MRTFYHALFREADEQSRHMRLIVPSDANRIEPVGRLGWIYHVKAPRTPIGDSRYRILSPLSPILWRILRREQPDLIDIGDKYSLPWVAALMKWRGQVRGGRPALVATDHERLDDNLAAYAGGAPLRAWLARRYMRSVYVPLFHWHIANSEYTAQELHVAAQGKRRPPRIYTLPMGADCEGLSPSRRHPEKRRRLIESLALADSAVLLLYAGRLAREKNLHLLVDMLQELPDRFVLLIAGGGAEEATLRQAAGARVPGRVKFLGHVRDRERLADLYANADVFVHPNPREPFGIAPLEAMASGLPLVAPNCGGVTSYANSGNAWLADPSGPAFAAAVMSVLKENVNTRASKLAIARRTAEEHRWPGVAGRFFALFDQIVHEAVSPAEHAARPKSGDSAAGVLASSGAAQQATA